MDQLDTGLRPGPPETPRWREALAPLEPRPRDAVVAEAERSGMRKTVSLHGSAPVVARSEESFSLVVLHLLEEPRPSWRTWSDLDGVPRITVSHITGDDSARRHSWPQPSDNDSGIWVDGIFHEVARGKQLAPDLFGQPDWGVVGVVELSVNGPRQACSVELRSYDLASMPVKWGRIPTDVLYDARRRLVERRSGPGG